MVQLNGPLQTESRIIHIATTCVQPILVNFINNAIKFTQEGSIDLNYEFLDDNKIRFSVTDTGSGIPQEKLKEIFNRFVQFDQFTQWTGLGLAICKSIVEQMGGQIGIDSTVGEGTTSWIIIAYQEEKKQRN